MKDRNTQHAFTTRGIRAFVAEASKLNRTAVVNARAQHERNRSQRAIGYRVGS
jgi:hypothetical protein